MFGAVNSRIMKFKQGDKVLVLNQVYKENVKECVIKEVGSDYGMDGTYVVIIDGCGTVFATEEQLMPYPNTKNKLKFLKLLYR